ncbi:MAG: hypothetical protein JST50_14705 [Bacteroidetes bacterium]|jgi:hypothetical protein|nr:hypothetical protein [Bacteroidota bacterium]
MRKKILFITGSINQTTQMHQISLQLPEYDCWFSQIFTDSKFLLSLQKLTGLGNNTILGGQFKARSEEYLQRHQLNMDYGGKKNHYDLVVYCSDLIVAGSLRKYKTIWVQEGMIDKPTFVSNAIKKLGLPAFVSGNTALNGSTNQFDIYCAASEGYKHYFTQGGTDRDKLFVTGIPNYDNCAKFLNNSFPYRDYVMVATSDMRETYRYEDREAFIRETVKIANGRQLLYKLHPNEKFVRAEAEIKKYAPLNTLIHQSGNTDEMIANCCELITQYSTVVYTGLALGKKVHSYFDLNELKSRMPIQNNGTSARNIANICRAYIEFEGGRKDFLKQFIYKPEKIKQDEEVYA